MPHHPSFTQLRRTQRLLGTALGAMIAVAMGAVMLGWAVGALPGIWVALLSSLTLVFVVISVTGYTLLHSQIETADTAMQANLASAHTDALTGTYTRSYFLEIVRRRLFGDTAQALGYMQIDMDKLKVLNDTMGHGAGDQALVHLVKVIRRLMPEAIIGRLGGDEFGIVLAGMDNKGALRRLGDEILRQLTDPIHISGRALRLSATIGVAVAPHDAADMDDLISKADLALYTGKRIGRSTSVAFEEDMLGDERHRRFVERELRAAILMNELQLHYQPIFAPDGKTLRSFEALVRWQHGVRGMIAPGAFIPVAEMSDLIDRLGDWVLRRACADMDRLVALGARSVAINISPVQLRRHDFVQRFAQILATCGVPPARLVVEVTETAPLLTGGIEADNLAALRAMGVRIAIDDFGAGYASLHYLRDFAFDIIKIDRSYVANIVTSRIDAMIVRTTCKFARSLPAEIIAEGVETPAQLALLRRAGCTGMQGFLLGRPQPLHLLEQFAREPAIASAA